jgi:hypothetical protein
MCRYTECAKVGPNGIVSIRWRVPRDLPAADSYVVKFQSHPLTEIAAKVEVANVKISTPLRIARVGRDEVQAGLALIPPGCQAGCVVT